MLFDRWRKRYNILPGHEAPRYNDQQLFDLPTAYTRHNNEQQLLTLRYNEMPSTYVNPFSNSINPMDQDDSYSKAVDESDDLKTGIGPGKPFLSRQRSFSAYSGGLGQGAGSRHDSWGQLQPKIPLWSAGWRRGVLFAVIACMTSLVLNSGVAIALSRLYDIQDGISVLFRGSCATVHTSNILIHLAINALGTALLTGSNYCMQCLTAPTRSDIDRAHAKGQWLDIGVFSIRNLRNVRLKNVCFWALLGLSSLPIHLIYNSAIFTTLATRDYVVYVVTEDFLNGTIIPTPAVERLSTNTELVELHARLGNYSRLDNKACLEIFMQDFVTDRSDVVIVTPADAQSNASIFVDYTYSIQTGIAPTEVWYEPYEWICSKAENVGNLTNSKAACYRFRNEYEAAASHWAPFGHNASYCLSQEAPEFCSLSANMYILFAVIGCNLVKVIVMLTIAFWVHDVPILTLGDAIASFLAVPDVSTKGLCLLSRKDIQKGVWPVNNSSANLSSKDQQEDDSQGKTAHLFVQRWYTAVSIRRWMFFVGLFIGSIATILTLMLLTAFSHRHNIYRSGFGEVNGSTLVVNWAIQKLTNVTNRIIASVFVANTPQLILSIMYFSANGILTSMVLSREWNNFAAVRKPLRVTGRLDKRQRPSHFLTLPFRIALPMMIISGVLHWLMSQSIFLASVTGYNTDGVLYLPTFVITCGWSPRAVTACFVFILVVCCAFIGLGFRRYNHRIPLAGSSSAAIAAACHPPAGEVGSALQPLLWGAVPSTTDRDDRFEIGHCTFTAGEVEVVIEGKKYA